MLVLSALLMVHCHYLAVVHIGLGMMAVAFAAAWRRAWFQLPWGQGMVVGGSLLMTADIILGQASGGTTWVWIAPNNPRSLEYFLLFPLTPAAVLALGLAGLFQWPHWGGVLRRLDARLLAYFAALHLTPVFFYAWEYFGRPGFVARYFAIYFLAIVPVAAWILGRWLPRPLGRERFWMVSLIVWAFAAVAHWEHSHPARNLYDRESRSALTATLAHHRPAASPIVVSWRTLLALRYWYPEFGWRLALSRADGYADPTGNFDERIRQFFRPSEPVVALEDLPRGNRLLFVVGHAWGDDGTFFERVGDRATVRFYADTKYSVYTVDW